LENNKGKAKTKDLSDFLGEMVFGIKTNKWAEFSKIMIESY